LRFIQGVGCLRSDPLDDVLPMRLRVAGQVVAHTLRQVPDDPEGEAVQAGEIVFD
jgi:hypothetical protein